MGDPQPNPRPHWFRPMPLALAGAVAVAAALYPLVPPAYRPWNVAAFGAIGLFVAARVGFLPAVLLALGSKLGCDLINYRLHGYDPLYVPDPTVYAGLALYAAAGWAFLRRTESAWRIAGVTVAAGVPFFLVTNFTAWLDPVHHYPQTLGGLLQSYQAALPFHRGTLGSDVVFTGLLFGTAAVLARVPRAEPEPVPVRDEVRS
jgi:hypothetical protein